MNRVVSCVAVVAVWSAVVHAQSAGDATRGQGIFKQRCASCHGDALEGLVGPPLKGADFAKAWSSESALADKIHKTMPQDNPGSLTQAQAIDVVAFIIRSGGPLLGGAATAPLAPVASHATAFPANANLAQLMRGIFFPSSNIIFNVQGHDPGEKKDGKPYEASSTGAFNWADWGAGIYSPWEVVDFAGLAIADAAPLLLVPRRCENGRQAPVENDDWNQFVRELIDAGKAAYQASQTRNQEKVSDVSNQLADACLHCHEVYRDKPGGTAADPSNKVARCFR